MLSFEYNLPANLMLKRIELDTDQLKIAKPKCMTYMYKEEKGEWMDYNNIIAW